MSITNIDSLPHYVVWGDRSQGAIHIVSEGGRAVERSSASTYSAFKNFDGRTSIRDQFTRRDYEFFRPAEAMPRTKRESIATGMGAYTDIGIVHNVIDLMGDFCSQGIRLIHRNKKQQRVYRYWFEKVNGLERSERFCNMLYRAGNVPITIQTAKLKSRDVDTLERGLAQPDIDKVDAPIKPMRNEIPWRYTILNPLILQPLDPDLSLFANPDSLAYGMMIPQAIVGIVRNPQTERHKQLVAQIPNEIVVAINSGQKVVPLNPEKLSMYHYKKDDWDYWAEPFTRSIFKDLLMLEKTKLADLAALDGAISHIRLWRLGSLEHKILPNDAMVAKLADALVHNVGGGSIDLIWDAALDLKETSSDIHHFLGIEKYIPVLKAIYDGLGIPSSLSGSGDKTTNSLVALRTLVERLKYGRKLLIDFWTAQVKIVQQAFGYREPAQIVFDHMVLDDEAAVNQLLLNMWDRNILSTETLREKLDIPDDIETVRIKREFKDQDGKNTPHKASPYHESQPEYGLEKIFAQTGAVTPDELGLDLQPRKPGSKSPLEMKLDNVIKVTKARPKPQPSPFGGNVPPGVPVPPGRPDTGLPKGQPGQGRPPGSKDTAPRKQKRVLPSAKAFIDLSLWAGEAQSAVAEVINPMFLKKCNKKNMRQLTLEESDEIELLKFSTLFALEPYMELKHNTIASLLNNSLPDMNFPKKLYDKCVIKFKESRGVEPTIDQCRQIQGYVYSLIRGK